MKFTKHFYNGKTFYSSPNFVIEVNPESKGLTLAPRTVKGAEYMEGRYSHDKDYRVEIHGTENEAWSILETLEDALNKQNPKTL